MSTIREAILSVKPAHMEVDEQVMSVAVEALAERERHLTDVITDTVVTRFGVSAAVVREQLTALGMEVRPAPAPAPTTDRLDAFEAQFASVPEPVADESEPVSDQKKGKKDKTAKRVNKLWKLAKERGLV